MLDIPNWTVAIGTLAGTVVSWWVGRASARSESLRYSVEQSREKEEAKVSDAIWKAEIKLKVDEMWNHMRRRGEVAAVLGGWGEVKSPLVANQRARVALAPLMADVMEFYKTKGYNLDPVLLRASMEEAFGERMKIEVCIPNKMHMNECLELALAIAREDYDREHGREQAQL